MKNANINKGNIEFIIPTAVNLDVEGIRVIFGITEWRRNSCG